MCVCVIITRNNYVDARIVFYFAQVLPKIFNFCGVSHMYSAVRYKKANMTDVAQDMLILLSFKSKYNVGCY